MYENKHTDKKERICVEGKDIKFVKETETLKFLYVKCKGKMILSIQYTPLSTLAHWKHKMNAKENSH